MIREYFIVLGCIVFVFFAGALIGFLTGQNTATIRLSKSALGEARYICRDKMVFIQASNEAISGKCGGLTPHGFKVENYKWK
jgi:hypothetical protein